MRGGSRAEVKGGEYKQHTYTHTRTKKESERDINLVAQWVSA